MDASAILIVTALLSLPALLALYGGRAVWRDAREGAWGWAIAGFIVMAISVALVGMLVWGFSGFFRTGGL